MTLEHEERTRGGGGFVRWWITVAVLVLLVAAFAVGRWTGDGGGGSTAVLEAAHDHDHDEDGEQIYYCPMHPNQTSTDLNATCPICGMDLVPMTDDAAIAAGEPVLKLTDRAMALLRIEVTPAERRTVTAPVRLTGRLESDETRLRDVVARSEFYIERLHANYRWKMVDEGEVLAEVYSPQVTAAIRELRVFQRTQDGGRRESAVESAIARLERLGLDQDQISQIVASDDTPRTFAIRSPMAGHVMTLDAREGDWLGDGERLLQIMDPWRLWLQLDAYERDLTWLHVGQPVELSVEAFPGGTFEGQIAFIDPHVDPRTRTARVRIEVDNPNARLKPGMFARGTAEVEVGGEPPRLAASEDGAVGAAQPPLIIPATAPLITGRRAIVYVQQPNTDAPMFEGRQVVLGPRAGDYYIVREGLAEGELVVSQGAFKLDSELQIQGRPSMMSALPFPEPTAEPPTAQISEEHPAYAVTPEQVPPAFIEQVKDLYGHYLELVAALAADDFDAAEAAVEAYHDLLIAMDAEELAEEARPGWQATVEGLEHPLHAMHEAEELKDLRFHLEPVGEYTALAVRTFGAGQVGPLYRMRCPMAIHDEIEADWFQDQPELRNPYMGQRMLRCGSMVEHILDADGRPAEE